MFKDILSEPLSPAKNWPESVYVVIIVHRLEAKNTKVVP
jgi:hypothetical protein